jgi:hypothetical protein
MFFCLSCLFAHGTPSSLGHCEFIAPLLQGSTRFQQASFKAWENADNEGNLRDLLVGDWRILCSLRASLRRTPKDVPVYCCTPIIDGKKSFWRTLKCYSRQSRASGPDRSKSEPVVQARERQADGDPSLVIGRGRVSSTMLSLMALARQKQLPRLWQAASQPASRR